MGGEAAKPLMQLTPIGSVATPWARVADCPRNGRQPDPPPLCRATVLPEYAAGLAGIEDFSHLVLLLWLDEAPPPRLVFTRPSTTPLAACSPPARHGGRTRSASTWSPSRGSTKRAGCWCGIWDCRDGTPLLDIKPYLPTIDAVPEARMGWLERHATRRPGAGVG